MKIKDFCRENKKKVIIISVCLVMALILLICVSVYFLQRNNSENGGFLQGGRGGFSMASGGVSASGVTSVGMTQESFEVENLETQLEIEEIYISSGDQVEAGAQILKLSQESVEEAREELAEVLEDAQLACRAGAIEYEQSKITAEYDYNSAVLAGEQAEEVYQETVESLTLSVEQAEEALAQAKEQIAEYESYVNDGSYSAYFGVDEYQSLYDENLKLLTDKMEEWGVSWSQVTSGGTGGMGGTGNRTTTVSSGDAGGGMLSSQYVSVLTSLYSVLEQNLQDLEQAQSEYEESLANAQFELQTLKLNLPSLEQAVTEAKQTYETQTLEAQLTYETALANAERAQSDYETALEQAESDYEDLKSTWEDAQENMDLFQSSVGDGYFYASASGTVLQVMARAGQYLTSDSTVFIYSNPEEISVTVSVDQSDIASLSVGDSAVVVSGTQTYEGSITQINPVTASESRTSVTYHVTVTLAGDTQGLETNQSVTVIFGAEDMEMPQEGVEMPEDGGTPPEGMEIPENEETPPEGMEMPENGETPPENLEAPDNRETE